MRNGRTTATALTAQAPLQWSRVRYDADDGPCTATLTLLHQGGMVQRDHYLVRATTEVAGRANVVGAGATVAYRMPRGSVNYAVQLVVHAQSQLVFLPGPLILCRDADVVQTIDVTISAGGRCVLSDVLVPGRLQRDERWCFRSYLSHLEVCDDEGRLLIADRYQIRPGSLILNGWEQQPVIGTLYLLGTVFVEKLSLVRDRLADSMTGVDHLPNGAGVLVRCLGDSATAVHGRLISAARVLTAIC
ncbi:MAG: hypothetical protein NVS2B7_10330 [Herpetosiphon sp.]